MIRIPFFFAFFASVFFAPWWMMAALGILMIAYFEAYLSVLLGTLLFDALFGTPVPLLFGIAHMYTYMFVALILLAVLLRRRLLE
ncbi:MAG: hypothetical protein ACE5F4_01435 [Candidatus Paceibacteria bacterium]